MEDQPNVSLFDMQVDDVGAGLLRETTRWTKFMAITIVVIVLLAVLFFSFYGSAIVAAFSTLGLSGQMFNAASGILIIVAVIVVAVVGFLCYCLYAFSTQTRKAVDFQDQAALEKGITALKNYFLVSGVVGILSVLSEIAQLFQRL